MTIGDENGIVNLQHLNDFFNSIGIFYSVSILEVIIMASTLLFGVLGEFDPSAELFNAYLERLEQFFIANSIGQCSADASPEVLVAADKKKSLCLFL